LLQFNFNIFALISHLQVDGKYWDYQEFIVSERGQSISP